MTIGTYAKAIAATAAAGLTAAITALDDGTITAYEWTVILIAAAVAAGAVWAIPNMTDGVRKYGKAATAGLIAVLGAIGAAVLDGSGISPDEWLGIAVALLSGLGLTYAVPNAEWSDGLGPRGTGPVLPSGDAPTGLPH